MLWTLARHVGSRFSSTLDEGTRYETPGLAVVGDRAGCRFCSLDRLGRVAAACRATTQREGWAVPIVTESWNRVVAVPYIVNMPEKDRVLMLVGCDYPHRAFVLTSDDHGATWTDPRPARVGKDGKPSIGMGTALAYLGKGKLMFYESGGLAVGPPSRWFSSDYGKTWGCLLYTSDAADE